MDSLKLPQTAAQAKVFTAPNSILFPKGIDGETGEENDNKDFVANGANATVKKEKVLMYLNRNLNCNRSNNNNKKMMVLLRGLSPLYKI